MLLWVAGSGHVCTAPCACRFVSLMQTLYATAVVVGSAVFPGLSMHRQYAYFVSGLSLLPFGHASLAGVPCHASSQLSLCPHTCCPWVCGS